MDASETIYGTRERAPAEEVMNSDIPTQLSSKRRRVRDLLSACVSGKEVVEGHASC